MHKLEDSLIPSSLKSQSSCQNLASYDPLLIRSNSTFAVVKVGSVGKVGFHSPYSRQVAVQSVAIHHRYNEDSINYNYDIAILELAETVRFNEFVQPICLPGQRFNFGNGAAYVTGWGKSHERKCWNCFWNH